MSETADSTSGRVLRESSDDWIGSECLSRSPSSLLGAKGGAKRRRRDERERPAVGAPRLGQGPDFETAAEQAVRPLPARLSAKTAVRFSRSLALVPSEERSVDMSSVGGHEERVSHRRSRVSRVPPREPHRTSRERRLYRREPARVGAFLTSPSQKTQSHRRHHPPTRASSSVVFFEQAADPILPLLPLPRAGTPRARARRRRAAT